MLEKTDYTPFTGTYQPFIKTKRFDIFHHRVVRNPKLGHPKEMFTAWFHGEDVPRPVCEVILWPNPYDIFVEWVHVCEEYRRQGIATEVLRALENKLGALSMGGATVAGEKFIASYKKPVKKKINKTKVKRVARKRN
jgi:hypothetical protein